MGAAREVGQTTSHRDWAAAAGVSTASCPCPARSIPPFGTQALKFGDLVAGNLVQARERVEGQKDQRWPSQIS